MASFVRRIQRTVVASQPHTERVGGELRHGIVNPPREKHWLGRGTKLGVRNPKAKDLVARRRRETSRVSA